MKKKWLITLILSLITLSILAVPAAAKTIRTEYEGVEDCDPEVLGGRQWVSEDGVLHIRDGQLACTDVVNDSRISGDVLVVVNLNYQFAAPPVFFYGPMWGKVRIENEGGYWEGSWVGTRDDLNGFSYIQIMVKGYGEYDGFQARATLTRESPDPGAPYQILGTIMEPRGH